MANDVLTPKVASKSTFESNLPTSDTAKVESTYPTKTEFTTNGFGVGNVNIPSLVAGKKLIVKIRAKSSDGTGLIEIRKADGTTVLGTFPALTSSFATKHIVFSNITPADWQGIRFFSNGNTGTTTTIEADSLRAFSAELTNITDITGIKYQVDNIYIYGLGEGLLGFISSIENNDFTTIPIAGLLSDIIFSANSGNILWTWEGYSIGVEP